MRSYLYAGISAVMVAYNWWIGEDMTRMDVAMWVMVVAVFVQRQPKEPRTQHTTRLK